MSESKLKHLLPQQYQAWLRKVDDPEWTQHRYRTSRDNAMASAIRELRDTRNALALAEQQRDMLREALEDALRQEPEWTVRARAALAACANGGQ